MMMHMMGHARRWSPLLPPSVAVVDEASTAMNEWMKGNAWVLDGSRANRRYCLPLLVPRDFPLSMPITAWSSLSRRGWCLRIRRLAPPAFPPNPPQPPSRSLRRSGQGCLYCGRTARPVHRVSWLLTHAVATLLTHFYVYTPISVGATNVSKWHAQSSQRLPRVEIFTPSCYIHGHVVLCLFVVIDFKEISVCHVLVIG